MTPERRLLSALAGVVAKTTVARIVRVLRSLDSDAGSMGANFWEDICVQVQGEQSVLWHLYEDQISGFARAEAGQLTALQRDLLWLQTDKGWDWAYDHFGSDTKEPIPSDVDDITSYLAQEVMNRAADYTNKRIEKLLEREHD